MASISSSTSMMIGRCYSVARFSASWRVVAQITAAARSCELSTRQPALLAPASLPSLIISLACPPAAPPTCMPARRPARRRPSIPPACPQPVDPRRLTTARVGARAAAAAAGGCAHGRGQAGGLRAPAPVRPSARLIVAPASSPASCLSARQGLNYSKISYRVL